MLTKCRSIATFHRPIHSHWSLPLSFCTKPAFRPRLEVSRNSRFVFFVWGHATISQGLHGVRIHHRHIRRPVHLRLFPRICAAQFRQLQRVLPGGARWRNRFCAPARQTLRGCHSRLHIFQVHHLSVSNVGDPWHFGVDPYLWLMDPDPTPFFSDLKDAKNYVFFL